MPNFAYRAYDQRGKLTGGTIEAASREGALAKLHVDKLFPSEVTEVAARTAGRWWEREVFGGGAMPSARLALLTQELATLAKADLPVDEALRIVAVQPLLPARVRRTAEALHVAVRGGASLSEALAARSPEFPEYYWRLIRAGEQSGGLAEPLGDLATFLERAGETRAKLLSALVYPAVLLVAAFVAVTVVMTVLLPTIVPLFKDAGASPPAALQFLLDTRDFVSTHWFALAAACALAVPLFATLLRNPSTRAALDRRILSLPIFGRLITARETARFARTFATLSRNGVPILDALRLTSSVLRNRAFSAAAHDAAESIKSGARLIEPLERAGIFPELALRLVSVGEQTDQLIPMTMHVADVFETAVQRQTAQLLTLLTPILTLLIGGGVGALILTVMNAILSVNELGAP